MGWMCVKQLGFIGTGVMGHSIVVHLLESGYPVYVYNRTKSKTDDLVEKGAIWLDSAQEVSELSDVTFTMLGYPNDVEEIYFGEKGIVKGITEAKTVVDLTTSTPSLAKTIYDEMRILGVDSLDAPVSGGDLGAKNGTLTMMVGGEKDVLDGILPILETFTGKVQLQGGAGAGQHTKMANQIMIAGTMTGMTELLVYANKAGLDIPKVLDTVGGGSAANWSLSNYGPRILKEDYSPGFFVKHFIKDLGIALNEAERMKINLPSTKLAKELYDQLASDGYENDGTQALIKLWWSDGIHPTE